MSVGEPPRWTEERNARMAQRYPELSQADAKTVMGVDGMLVGQGRLPSAFSQSLMRLAAASVGRK